MKGKHLGEFEELVLLAVRHLGTDASVLAIKNLLDTAARRKASLGAIYAALDRAERKGLSESRLGEALPEPGGRARRYYALTAAGESALAESRSVREQLWLGPGEIVP